MTRCFPAGLTYMMLGGLLLAHMLLPDTGHSQSCDLWVVKLVSAQGTVLVQQGGQTQKAEAVIGDTYASGVVIFVGERSRATVHSCEGGQINLDQNTTLAFVRKETPRKTLIELIQGAIHGFSRMPRALDFLTEFFNGSVEGTEFYVRVESRGSDITVFDGRIRVENRYGDLILSSGDSARVTREEAPRRRIQVRPRDAVQWTLYYPPVVAYRPEDFGGDAPWPAAVRRCLEFYAAGDLTQALQSLADAPETIRDERFHLLRAALLLTVGRVDEAAIDLQKAVALDPASGLAQALEAVIAVARNDREKALDLASRAVNQNPGSATANIALSYARQAFFDLDGALASVQAAVENDPQNALAWARLSELQLSFGHLDKALDSAEKAASLNPSLARTQTVLGFARLTQIRTAASIAAFEKAVELEPYAPLARLGLGLAKIRQGELAAGTQDLEIAVALDPNNALYRSYLGKAYHEEKRTDLDGRQYAAAKALDPLDPTPWYYNAIRLQSINRPVEALGDLLASIRLNDNRAVYRSRLLLDEDLAARSASVARIYRDLGFQQLALAEGYRSVNTDPANFSAHRFLADAYAALPRHDIAKVSELLQSQLLQPINITPVQPGLAESSSFILSGAGPADPAFNEFTPLFNRDRLALQANGVVGENGTKGDEIVLSGVQGRMSFSAGQYGYETDGFRENDDLSQKIYNVFAQASLTHKTSVMAEYRYKDLEHGDLFLRYDPDLFFPSERREDQSTAVRGGFRHAFSPGSDLIGVVTYGDLDSVTSDSDPFFSFELNTDDKGVMAEVQHLFRWDLASLTGGAGYYDADRETADSLFGGPFVHGHSDIRQFNLYAYAQIRIPEPVTWTVGASGDFHDGIRGNQDRFNPKFGFTWQPRDTTTLRGAVFRTLKRTLLSQQTIEPTQVAGFNQFFDDTEGTEAWRYGVAVDQKLPGNVFGGAEVSWRDLKVPYEILTPVGGLDRIATGDWDESFARAYTYWAPCAWLTVSAEYQYEKLERDPDSVAGELFTQIRTHRLPLGAGFFHPSGLSATARATYVDQEGRFGDPFSGFESNGDRFWVVDAAIRFRLPKRYGILSVEARNLFDETFRFQDTDPANPDIAPGRQVLGKFTLAF